ncbi:hypothetical protein QQF64_018228 [Cirrhinus molitorella]|uniref:Uncharacterized protein n=1 Tax=Cirrhinus molitorella TaxID=172907 RepID=A0ABR3LKV2_9TELE
MATLAQVWRSSPRDATGKRFPVAMTTAYSTNTFRRISREKRHPLLLLLLLPWRRSEQVTHTQTATGKPLDRSLFFLCPESGDSSRMCSYPQCIALCSDPLCVFGPSADLARRQL